MILISLAGGRPSLLIVSGSDEGGDPASGANGALAAGGSGGEGGSSDGGIEDSGCSNADHSNSSEDDERSSGNDSSGSHTTVNTPGIDGNLGKNSNDGIRVSDRKPSKSEASYGAASSGPINADAGTPETPLPEGSVVQDPCSVHARMHACFGKAVPFPF